LPPLDLVAARAELDPSRRLLFTPNTRMESDAAHAVPAPGAPTALTAAAAEGATEGTAPGRARAAHQGTHMDDLVQTILDRLNNHDARTTERIDALVAAQVASQSQIERLRRRRRTSRPHDNQEELHEHNLLRNRTLDTGRLLHDRHIDDENRSRDQELTRLNALIRDMSSKMHRATTAAPELEKVLEETQRSPFTERLSAIRVLHINKVKLVPYNGLTDPKIFLKSMCIAINPITDDAAIGALRNALLFGSRFREDLIIARPSTFGDALHRANRYVEIEEENAAMMDRNPKASNSRDKTRS
ncbi:unnamed protein product, partial [Arabidopsis halleri]